MNELAVLDTGKSALHNVANVTLQNIPKLTRMVLRLAFANVRTLKIENASMLEMQDELLEVLKKMEEEKRLLEEKKKKEAEEERKRLEEEERVRSEQLILETRERIKKGIVLNAKEFHDLPLDIKAITVNGCDDYQSEVLDFSRYDELEELRIGTKCFDYVSKVSIAGLEKLKCVEIGESSFQNNSSDCQLVVKNCPLLSSLTIGDRSFKWFKAFVLDKVPALKTLTIGMYCFKEVSFVAKNLKSVEEIRLGDSSFEKSRHTVMESDSEGRD